MRNLASHLGLADAWSLVELQLGCFMSRDPEWMDCSHLAYLMHFQYTAFPGLLYKVQTVQAHWGHIFATMHCCYAVHTAQLLPQISFKCQNVLRTQSKVLKSGPNLKPLSQNTFIIIWSFLYTFIILSFLVYSWQVSVTDVWAVRRSAATLRLHRCGIQFAGLITRSNQGTQTDCSQALHQKKKRRNLIKCSSLVLKWREYLANAIKCYKNTTASELRFVFQLLPQVEKEST